MVAAARSIEISIEPGHFPVRSLAWWGDDLIDWLGGHRWTLNGDHQTFGVGSTYGMNAAVGWRDVGVCYEQLGTKGRIARWNGNLPRPGWVPLGRPFRRTWLAIRPTVASRSPRRQLLMVGVASW